jgi:two-component system alkaline phosphatase synthesis response regulator PhoP
MLKMLEKQRVLAVDDDKDILELLSYNLGKEGFDVKTLQKSDAVVSIARKFKPDLIILDIMMPGADGIETCQKLRDRKEFDDVYISFLTARGEEYSEVAGFESGADDYLIKPIRPRALVSRINSIISRATRSEHTINSIRKNGLEIDRTSYTVKLDGMEVNLPKKEFELLYFLADNANKIFSRESLLSKVWGNDVHVLSRTVDVHIRKIREKIGEEHIVTIKGVGYKFEE